MSSISIHLDPDAAPSVEIYKHHDGGAPTVWVNLSMKDGTGFFVPGEQPTDYMRSLVSEIEATIDEIEMVAAAQPKETA